MYTIKQNLSNIYKINKSKFLSFAFCVQNEEEIEHHLKQLKKEYHDASHICYAYVLNDPVKQKFNDDNEPAKTAGFQILNLINKANLTNCLIVIIRYFGGVKLGIGLLSRSYLQAAKLVVDNNIIEYIDYIESKIEFNYSKLKEINNYIKVNDIEVIQKEFNEDKIIYFIKYKKIITK